jgi:hypothetical protein
MRCCQSTPGSAEYILHVGHSTSVRPVSLYTHLRSLTIDLKALIELVWGCTGRANSSELRDSLRGRDQSSLGMHLEAVIKRVWRRTWRPRSSKFGDALRGRDRDS